MVRAPSWAGLPLIVLVPLILRAASTGTRCSNGWLAARIPENILAVIGLSLVGDVVHMV